MGVRIGEGTKIQNDVVIDYSHYWLIEIGKNVTMAPRVHILAHDASTKRELGYARLGYTQISDGVFIGANTIVLPNVKIGENSIVGAGSVVTKDVPANMVVVGNPARVICSTQEYYDKVRSKMNSQNTFDELYTIRKNVSDEKKQEMIKVIAKFGCGFVE
jgi:maltose O-acetyltransferase